MCRLLGITGNFGTPCQSRNLMHSTLLHKPFVEGQTLRWLSVRGVCWWLHQITHRGPDVHQMHHGYSWLLLISKKIPANTKSLFKNLLLLKDCKISNVSKFALNTNLRHRIYEQEAQYMLCKPFKYSAWFATYAYILTIFHNTIKFYWHNNT